MRQFLVLLLWLTVTIPSLSAAQQCFPVGFVVKGEPWQNNSIISATACVINTAPGNVVDVAHNNQFNFIFDSQIGVVDSVSAPAVQHQTGYTPPANPISSGDFTAFIDSVNLSKFRIQFTPSTTGQIAVNDTICVDFTFATGNAGTYAVSFFSNVTGFGSNVPSNSITVQ